MERGGKALRFLDRYLGIPLTVPSAIFRKFDNRKANDFGRIGIFCPGAIGDLLLLSGLVDGIKKILPESGIEIIATNANKAALPLIPHIGASFALPVRDIPGMINLLRKRRHDILFDASQWARLGAIVCAFSGAALTVGFRSRGQYRSLPYDIVVEHGADRHEVENFLNLGRALWPDLKGAPQLILPEKIIPKRGDVVYCHMWPAPGKGRGLKQWPPGKWAELIAMLIKAGYEIRLTGSGNDIEECDKFLNNYFPGRHNPISVAGKYNLVELAPLLAQAAAVISVNTGIMHLAALTGTPTIGLHGATNPLRWGPVGEKALSLMPHKGRYAYLNLGFEYPANAANAMEYLPVADVVEALRSFGLDV